MHAAIALLLLASPDAVDEMIARGDAAMTALEYDVAVDEFNAAATSPTATDAQRMRASIWAGIASVIVGMDTVARVHFRYVLLKDPQAELPPEMPQKVTSFFALVRNELEAELARNAPPPAEAPPPPVQIVQEASSPLPLVVVGTGAVATLAGVALLASAEAALGDAALPVEARDTWQLTGRAAALVAGAGVVAAAVGGALLILE